MFALALIVGWITVSKTIVLFYERTGEYKPAFFLSSVALVRFIYLNPDLLACSGEAVTMHQLHIYNYTVTPRATTHGRHGNLQHCSKISLK